MKFLIAIGLAFCFISCEANTTNNKTIDIPTTPIIVIYENDVHCAVEGYAKLVGLREQYRLSTPYITTVSCGDFSQGDVVGSVSKGENIVEIMNKVNYDVVTLGNHEFDYGMDQMFRLASNLEATIVNANFRDLRTNELLFSPYHIISYGDVDIAYMGLTTTTTVTSVSPKTFQDNEGNFIYDFFYDDFYVNAQKHIDAARKSGADYLVLLSHLGDMNKGEHVNSIELIKRTKGIDVVLDAHDHHVIPDTLINNLIGNPVLLTSTGTKFENVGVLTLSTEGYFSSKLVSTQVNDAIVDEEIQIFVEDVKQKALADGMHVIGFSEVDLSIYDEFGNRIVRNQETNIGNFCADALRKVINADVAMVNGGGIRADLLKGEITYNDLLSVFPFNNTICTATITGQQLLDALELSVFNLPEENGNFMQVSGMKFEVDLSVPTSIVLDENSLFLHVGKTRRVRNLYIFDVESGKYEPIDLNRIYTLASFDFQIKNLGSMGIFRYATLKEDNLGQDAEVLASYIELFLAGKIGNEYKYLEDRIVIK